jgi:tetratricopeptide (TPR) repeat protein
LLLAPKDGPSYYRAARRLRRAGYLDSAAQYYQRAVGFNEHHYQAWVEWIDTLVRAGRLEEADAQSRQALDAYRKVRLFYATRALTLAHQGAFEEALTLAGIGIEGEGAWYACCVQAELFLLLPVCHRKEALTWLNRAIDCAEDRWEPCSLGGRMLLDAGLAVWAAGFYSEAAHADPLAAAGWLGLGETFERLRLYDQALFYYRKVTELEPRHEYALEAQRRCAPRLFGLTRVFRKDTLRRRWNSEFEKIRRHEERMSDDA